MITYRGEQLAVIPLLRPVAPTLQRFGSAGETTYTYQVVAVLSTGHTEASPVATITTGPATLSQLHAIDIIPPYVQGAASYDIYRVLGGLSQGKIGSVTARNSGTIQGARFRDRGQVGDDAVAPLTNTTGTLLLPGLMGQSPLGVNDAGEVGSGGGGGGSLVRQTTTTIDSAHLKDLVANPVTVLDAPAEGTARFLRQLLFHFTYIAPTYTSPLQNADLMLALEGHTVYLSHHYSIIGAKVAAMNGVGGGGAQYGDPLYHTASICTATGVLTLATAEALLTSAIVAWNPGGEDFTDGNGTVSFTIVYELIDLTTGAIIPL